MNTEPKPNDRPVQQENFQQSKDRDVVQLFTFVRTVLVLAVFLSIGFLLWTAHMISKATDELTIASTSAEALPPAEGPGASTIRPDIFRVTSISQGEPRIAIVNGQRVGPGDSVRVQTKNGLIAARVTKIADDEVEIKFAGETIPLELSPATTPAAP